jgi:hypothetical protein
MAPRAKRAKADKPEYAPFRRWKAALAISAIFGVSIVALDYIAGRFFGPFGGPIAFFILFPIYMLADAAFFHGCWFIGGVVNEYDCPGKLARVPAYILVPFAIYLLIASANLVIHAIYDEDEPAKEKKVGKRKK